MVVVVVVVVGMAFLVVLVMVGISGFFNVTRCVCRFVVVFFVVPNAASEITEAPRPPRVSSPAARNRRRLVMKTSEGFVAEKSSGESMMLGAFIPVIFLAQGKWQVPER